MTTTIDGVFVDLTGSLARSGISAASFAELSDDGSENTHRAIAQHAREVAKYVALSAANVASRSDWALGREGLARKKGYGTAEDYVQALGGGGGSTKADTRRLIEAGTMAAEAETARARQEQADRLALAHPEAPPVAVHMPWFAPLGAAVTDGTLSTDAATALRRGLGEPAIGVTDEMLADAVVALIAECRSLNADQAAKVARQCRDSIDAAGIASRADAMRARQYLRVWDKPDGMLHGSFELDPENGSYFKDFLLQITGPRQGGPRFVEKGEKERAQRIIADPRSTDQIAAEALIEVIKVAAAADPGTLFGRIRPSVKLVVIEAPAPAPGQSASSPLLPGNGFIEGSPDAVPTTTIDRSVCNTGFIPVLFSRDGTVLDVGREQRLFTQAQRAVLALRDGGCMWPECHRPPSYSEAHHLHGWDGGGLTNVSDGILLCARDHLRLHNDGWKIRRTGTEYWLIPPPTVDTARAPIRLVSKSPLKPGSPLRRRALATRATSH
ncbi:HNH endonuclease signature motif containing protein [Cryobacterium psychrophilum]|uniref:HNH endonuclease n=1 Tax=Cryobacterium psychrophilum TaxID=41988 RepID=A0A4Y8KSB0_9MICO|nr:HNH endonuclease signature motif containing protein [Cryobacterium psychrophilum]TDW29563.1 uncharacterized protein DUF222 [Cryobacterium psychrophilum]TFD81697.1 HNH endonuclease [Cryobacterium psychrophilum]